MEMLLTAGFHVVFLRHSRPSMPAVYHTNTGVSGIQDGKSRYHISHSHVGSQWDYATGSREEQKSALNSCPLLCTQTCVVTHLLLIYLTFFAKDNSRRPVCTIQYVELLGRISSKATQKQSASLMFNASVVAFGSCADPQSNQLQFVAFNKIHCTNHNSLWIKGLVWPS